MCVGGFYLFSSFFLYFTSTQCDVLLCLCTRMHKVLCTGMEFPGESLRQGKRYLNSWCEKRLNSSNAADIIVPDNPSLPTMAILHYRNESN